MKDNRGPGAVTEMGEKEEGESGRCQRPRFVKMMMAKARLEGITQFVACKGQIPCQTKMSLPKSVLSTESAVAHLQHQIPMSVGVKPFMVRCDRKATDWP